MSSPFDLERQFAEHRARELKLAEMCAREAAAHEAAAEALKDAQGAAAIEMRRGHLDQARELREREEALRGKAGPGEGLRERLPSGRVTGEMHVTHRIARSAAADPGEDAWIPTINAAGFTQATLAAKLKISPTLLSLHRNGTKPIPEDRAQRIEKLTGWPAAKWPSKSL